MAKAARHHEELGGGLLELVKIRVSLLNGCAYCIDRHTQDARRGGGNEQRWDGAPTGHDRMG
ncbi:carboxymuconolactone decarboxylase family protein [Halomonas salifodinae]|uniref:Carboxymuconolactone decarboxylase family protein n=1 Tax=Halomonas salifodinae TaxID=438745 RepID=A0ABW2ESN0_9GAMM